MSEGFSGGCLCGAVRYETKTAPKIAGHCQCVDCRRSSGTGHCTHMMLDASAVTLTGETRGYERETDSGSVVTRVFCPTCGAGVYSLNSAMPDQIALRASSLDDPEVCVPSLVVYASRGPSWDRIDPELVAFPEMPPQMPREITSGG